MRITILIALLGLLAAGTALMADPPAPPATAGELAARPLKIGYVDLARVMKGYERAREIEKGLSEFQSALREQQRALVSKIERYRGELDQLAMGTPEYQKTAKEHAAASKELDQFRATVLDQMNRKLLSSTESLYNEILREIERLGKERSFDFILKEQTPEIPATNYNQALFQISQRIVLYSRPEYDLTATVTQRLNAQYALQEKTEAAADTEQTAGQATEKR